ncbi:hypothetical protein FOCC_FOCC016421 [Frankliniella occidentalis]|nr:hypothetical protein FOCC_FOCC016421 [Frankliniella occidentalis]
MEVNSFQLVEIGGCHRGFSVMNNHGRGDCFFASVSQALWGNQSRIKEIRRAVVNYAATNWFKVAPFTHDAQGNIYDSIESYAADMLFSGWGTECECQIAAIVYKKCIVVVENKKIAPFSYGDPKHPLVFLNHVPGINSFGERTDSGGHWEYMVFDDFGLPMCGESSPMLVLSENDELLPVSVVSVNCQNTSLYQILAFIFHNRESFAHNVIKNCVSVYRMDRSQDIPHIESAIANLQLSQKSDERERLFKIEEEGKKSSLLVELLSGRVISENEVSLASEFYKVKIVVYRANGLPDTNGTVGNLTPPSCESDDIADELPDPNGTVGILTPPCFLSDDEDNGLPDTHGTVGHPTPPNNESDGIADELPDPNGTVGILTPSCFQSAHDAQSGVEIMDVGDVPERQPQAPTVTDSNSDIPEHERIMRGKRRYLPDTHYKVKPSMAVKESGVISKWHKCAWLFYGEKSSDFSLVTLPPLDVECPNCKALFRKTEIRQKNKVSAMCCDFGKVRLPAGATFKEPAPAIKAKYVSDDTQSKAFRAALVSYNRVFSMACAEGNLRSINTRGYESMIVNGQLRFVANSYLRGDEQNAAKPGELYFVEMSGDVAAARLACSTRSDRLNEATILEFEHFLRRENKLIRTFVTAGEKVKEEKQKAAAENRSVRDVILAINPRPSGKTSYRGMWNYYRNYTLDPNFDMPTNEYMGAVFYDELKQGVHYDVRYFIRPQRNGDASDILNRGDKASLDMLMFPLLHLHGEFSWCVTGDPDVEFPKLSTLREYYKYRIQLRNEEWNPLFLSERLFLQYLITAAIRCEYNDVDYHSRPELQKIYMETYKTVINFVNELANGANKKLGRVALLPSRVAHTERNRRNRFLDVMAITTKFKCPSYFITMTANPHWQEIQDDLPDVKWCFKPQVVVRVFLQKMAILMHLLVQKQCFGRALAYACVIEYQKRGLPHCHVILTVHPDDMPQCGREVDLLIRAEIPDKEKEPELYELVTKLNLHHLCHEKNRRNEEVFCRLDGKHCKSRFPKDFCDETTMDGRRVNYRRRDTGITYKNPSTGEIFDNRQVVAFSPFLTLELGTNTNAELCSGDAQSNKYISLYMNKSGDQVYTSIAEENLKKDGQFVEWDEIQFYKKMRFLGSMEAVTSIMGVPEIYKSHSVTTLPVHDEGEQTILWEEGGMARALENGEKTMLTEYFKLNENSDKYRHKMYVEVVETHSWHEKEKYWKERKLGRNKEKRESCIARLCIIPLSAKHENEYYLRSLLLNIPGPRSFEHIRTVNNIVYASYKEACIALGLLIDDREAERCMNEICELFNGKSIRKTFALILVFMRPHDAISLWTKYRDNMIDDFKYKHRMTADENNTQLFTEMALHHIQSILMQHNVTLDTFGLPSPSMTEDDIRLHCLVTGMVEEISLADKAESLADMTEKIGTNPQQLTAFNTIMTAVRGNRQFGNLFYLKGRGGCGKTYLLNAVILTCEVENIAVQVSAFTGVAAKLLRSGKTSHKVFGLSVKDSDQQLLGTVSSSIQLQSPQAQRLRDSKLIIWDEISMATAVQLETVNMLLKEIMNSNEPFGGKVLVVSGDFCQCLPVLPGKGRKDIVEACVPSSPLWQEFKTLKLDKNMRLNSDDQEFADWMVSVGNGSANIPGSTRVEIPNDLTVESREDLIQHVFGDFSLPLKGDAAILCPRNDTVNEINDIVLDRINGEERVYLSDTYIKQQGTAIQNFEDQGLTKEYLETLNPASLPFHRLRLRVGSVVMLMRNMNFEDGLCNGTKLIVQGLGNNALFCRGLEGDLANEVVIIPRVTLATDEFRFDSLLCRKQFPVRLCMAMTINRSQGGTLRRAGIYLATPSFSHGQLYVGVSRVRSRGDLKVLIEQTALQGTMRVGSDSIQYTVNEVYDEIIRYVG